MIENKKNFIYSGILILLAILFTVLVKVVNVERAGQTLTEVGFSGLNSAFFDATGVNKTAYLISDILGYVALSLVALYFVLAVRQAVLRKSLLKIDKSWWALAVFYIIVFIAYIVFDKIAINYRPILKNGELEPSYPSSHTLLSLSVCLSSIIINRTFYKNIKLANYGNIALCVLCVVLVICRLLSGYHWLTDIIGGIIIASALVMCLYTAVCLLESKKKAE